MAKILLPNDKILHNQISLIMRRKKTTESNLSAGKYLRKKLFA